MTDVHAQFAAALKARLNGRVEADQPDESVLACPSCARQGQLDEAAIAAATAEVLSVPFAEDLAGRSPSQLFLSAVPIAFARRHGLLGLAGENGTLTVAMSDLSAWPQLEGLAKRLAKRIEPVLVPRLAVLRAINAAYQQSSSGAQRVVEELSGPDAMGELARAAANEDLLDTSGRAPVIRLVNLVLLEAVKRRASDVHVQPYEDKLVIRFRIDGVLQDVLSPRPTLHAEIVSRIKVMGGMNIAEHRLAQDGRATVEVGDRIVDLRISTLPTSFGERAVIRLLDKSLRLYRLGELGMPEAIMESFRRLIHADHGIILVTGPTGSGKTTTLYAALQEINSVEKNILTLEDPIEYRLEGISQTQVSERKGMTFASGLRHVLRQDPDIIMVGEVRDAETARMAIQSALTGHLVFSTLHTNDAAGAVARMLDLGVEPYLLASSLLGVLAQRLVRRICPQCRVPVTISGDDRRRWDLAPHELSDTVVHRGGGCAACEGSGYHERLGIFELLTVVEPIRELILQRAKASSLKAAAQAGGMTTLRAAGLDKVRQGVTTMDEVARITGRDEG